MGVIFLISIVNSLNAIPLKCVLIKNQECEIREVVVNNKYMTYPYSIKVNSTARKIIFSISSARVYRLFVSFQDIRKYDIFLARKIKKRLSYRMFSML